MIAVLCTLTLLQGPGWSHVVPPVGTAGEHAPLRALALVAERPEGVEEKVDYHGHRRHYTQVRYGAAGTTRIAIAFDELDGGEVELYVDADRDRAITAADRVPGAGPRWRLALELVTTSAGEGPRLERPALLELFPHSVGFAPIGYVEGKAALGDRQVLVRRVDAEGNASYADAKDRLLVDVDGDGSFDPFAEVFFYAPVLEIAGERWIVREEEQGDGVSFSKLEGTGDVELVAAAAAAKPRTLTVTLQSRDGVTLGLDALETKVKAPIGTYRVVHLDATFDDAKGGPPWGFVFSAEGEATRWFEVGKDASVVIDPFAGLELTLGLEAKTAAPGEIVHLRPRLTTADGLLINTCYRGQHTGFGHGGPSAAIELSGPDGRPLDTASSGFA